MIETFGQETICFFYGPLIGPPQAIWSDDLRKTAAGAECEKPRIELSGDNWKGLCIAVAIIELNPNSIIVSFQFLFRSCSVHTS